jgi:hypothetical protein
MVHLIHLIKNNQAALPVVPGWLWLTAKHFHH